MLLLGIEPRSTGPQPAILSAELQEPIKTFIYSYLKVFCMAEKVCSSCKSKITNIEGATSFKCPNCGAEEMVRCSACRKIAAKYKCSKCGFEGPN